MQCHQVTNEKRIFGMWMRNENHQPPQPLQPPPPLQP